MSTQDQDSNRPDARTEDRDDRDVDREAIVAGLTAVRERVRAAAEASGRRPEDVALVAISKTQPASAIRAAYEAGQRDFGENYAQELARKRTELADLPDIRWHFVGALQTNKAKFVVPGTSLVHAVDRLAAAEALGKRAVAAGGTVDVLLEVNVGGEESKAGVTLAQVPDLADAVVRVEGCVLRGLMCIPPPASGDDVRRYFAKLRDARDELRARLPTADLLSMGMSGDYEEAIAEGATHVRVGTAIFGARRPRA